MDNSAIEETANLLVKLIQSKCVNPPGNEMRSIKTIEAFLTAKGIDCQVFESAPDRGNLVAKIKGNGQGPRLMFGPSHVDVVPVENPDDWTVDPFSGEIKDGEIWGRGALDMLLIVATQVQAFAKLHEEGFQPKGELTLLVVADEEAGGHYGAEWMVKNHWELIQTDFAVTEFGGASIVPGKFFLTVGEKGATPKRITFKGTPGHGSMPYGSDNAVNKAARAIDLLTDYCDSKIPLNTEYLSYLIKGLDRGFLARLMITNKILLPFTLKRLNKKNPEMAKLVHSLSRMTISANMVQGGVKINVIPTTASIDLDIRTLPGQDDTYVTSHLKQALGDLANDAEIEPFISDSGGGGGIMSYGNASPAESEFVSTMERVIQKELPNTKLVPFMVMGATDARFLREKGVEAYGFALFDPEVSMDQLIKLVHGTNERVSLKTVELSLRAYYNLAKELLA
ncbi:MAG: M20/M25/M40 family metallo-hydrolase [Candidatus Hodarchaeales archaeon]|jgi:acetylornithine deacetylase/succinyl-diaminopimelate desuccinylase-like protein